LQKATMMASFSSDKLVDFGSLGPVGRSATEPRFFHFATVFGLIHNAWTAPQALLTILYCSTDCLRRCGAAVKNLLRLDTVNENLVPRSGPIVSSATKCHQVDDTQGQKNEKSAIFNSARLLPC
jgi:hypothetical protein